MKLKVGDIEMDSVAGISFAGSQSTYPATPPVSNAVGQPANAPWGLPAWPSRTYWALCAVGTIAAASVVLGSVLLGLPLALIAVVPALAGMAVGSALVAQRTPSALPACNVPDDVLALRTHQITALLSSAKEPVFVEWIAEALNWSETVTVTGLRRLVETDRVQEDLDLETGHWTYKLATSDRVASRQAMPILERERALLASVSQNEDE